MGGGPMRLARGGKGREGVRRGGEGLERVGGYS